MWLTQFSEELICVQGVEWFPGRYSKSPVLKQGISYMECQVSSRMETADHWITYCVVLDGEVLQPDQKTAVHRRKVGTYYWERQWITYCIEQFAICTIECDRYQYAQPGMDVLTTVWKSVAPLTLLGHTVHIHRSKNWPWICMISVTTFRAHC